MGWKERARRAGCIISTVNKLNKWKSRQNFRPPSKLEYNTK